MEFLLWLWVWDKRILPCFGHGTCILQVVWLIPLLISLGFFGASVKELNTQESMAKRSGCSGIDVRGIQSVIIMQLAFIVFMLILLLTVFIQSVLTFRKHNIPSHLYSHPECNYDF